MRRKIDECLHQGLTAGDRRFYISGHLEDSASAAGLINCGTGFDVRSRERPGVGHGACCCEAGRERKERHCIATLDRAGAEYPVAGRHPRLVGSTSALYLQRSLRECMALRRNLAREAAIRLRAALCGMPAHRRRSERADPRSGLCSGSSWQCVACRHHWRHNVLIIGKSPLKPS
jgi:hypothetical protein